MSKVGKERPRLGRGLSSLISVATPPPEVQVEVAETPVVAANEEVTFPREVPISDISPNPYQPRKDFSEEGLAELAASLKQTGLIQPVVVKKADGGYQLIAGERRWRAAKLAGLSTIPVIVREVDSLTQAQMAVIENVQREDLNPIDRASAYKTLLDQLGLTQAELAGRLAEERSSIANYLRLLDLAEPVQILIRSGVLSLGHAKILAGIADPIEQERLAKTVADQGLSVRALEKLMAEGAATAKKAEPKAASPHVQSVETAVSRQLGMRVQLKAGGKGKGKLVIHYASLDQFDELLQRLGIKLDD